MVEDIVGCKRSLTALEVVRGAVHRPGRMRTKVPGLSPKVLNERLEKLLRSGIVECRVFAAVPPHAERRSTEPGTRIGEVLDRIAALDRKWEASPEPTVRRSTTSRTAAPVRARAAGERPARRKGGRRAS